ncbi:[weak similarity to] Plasmid maintenance system antidote protein [methanotrophic bacterial endosymbiont of Bathymodiolus sp.]|nr:[weak similarity to] Plasmid maintenance system antidote protein [methanotrophic bacterial endosymbiont of Bathymodiolus sp.]
MIEQHNPMHPGEFIKRVYLIPCHIGSNELARNLKASDGLVSRLIMEKRTYHPLWP